MLRYDEEPNYAKLRFLLSKELLEVGFLPDTKFSWIFDDRYQLSGNFEDSDG